MARILTEGFEFGDNLFFSTITNSPSVQTTRRSGSYALQCTSNVVAYGTLPGSYSEWYARIGFRSNDMSQYNQAIRFRASGTDIISVGHTNNGRTLIWVGSSGIASGSIELYSNTWYLLEIWGKIADSSGRIVVKVDGIVDIDYTGDTKPDSNTTINQFLLRGGLGAGSPAGYFDDIAFNDTTGGSDNSWCGDGRIILLKPNANGDSSDWVGSDGNSTDNYALVDDIPASSSDYVESSTSGNTDLYNLEACGLSSVTIHRIWPEARAADTVAEGGQIYLPIKTGGTQYDGTAVSLLTTYTRRLLGDIRTVNPYSSSAWSTSDLDALQVGAKVV